MGYARGDDAGARVGETGIVRDRFDALSVMVACYHGPELRVVAANAAFRSFAGSETVLGRSFDELFAGLAAQRLSPVMASVFATGEPQTGREWRVQVGGGREFYLDFVIEPYRDVGGTIVGITGIGIDVTGEVQRRQTAQDRAVDAELRYAHARDVITALQRQLLPQGLPVLPALRIAGSYLLADADDAAGGDWFDAVPLTGGRVALAVGDVVGHGVAASAAMGQLRAVLQDRLDEAGDLMVAIRAADRMARRVPAAHAATVCVVVLDPADGTLTWCSAGHPPPLLVGADSTRFLPVSGSGPLGTGAGYTTATDRLQPGEAVLLYSDGIIERPGREPAAATVELSQVAADAFAGRIFNSAGLTPADRICLHTLELLVRQTGHTDDITLLAAQRRAPAPPLRLGGPGTTLTARATRSAVDAWLTVQETRQEDRVALTHAVTELVTNALTHGRPDTGPGTVTVTAELRDDGEAQLSVADDGRWREPSRPAGDPAGADHGLGLAMAAAFTDHLDIDRGAAGTTVTVRRRLSRPARLLTGDEISVGVRGAPDEAASLMLVLDQPNAPSNRIAIHGPLDASNVEELGVELDRRTLGGTHELIVDLTAVTHLSSAAVAELYRSGPRGSDRHYPLQLYASAGSTAHHVLGLVGLPHTTRDPHDG
ncbi:SpoIIE family protein phosphatase [Paractinoplanes rishiriensis]|uniref:Uncharacterized protein n=1 Tax=Paractinoplanes rishiriensis TaxID=1050105 RepID=A0A919JYV6_9ACTN|nr:SpoIIE family protein phosphatase [Actinoplanes rishiriensis]GIE97440.1 hypothetical protein Ari01nite_49050 [Actinoplanes rishiriensis]